MTIRNLLLPPFVLGLLWLAAIWWPAQMLLDNEQREIDAQQSQQLSLVSEVDRLNQRAALAESIQADRERIDAAIPGAAGIDDFLAVIAERGEANDVNIRAVSPLQIMGPDSADPLRPVPPDTSAVVLSLSADGNFVSAMTFLRDLRELDRLVVIDTLAMSAVEGGGRISLDVGLRIFTTGDEVETVPPQLTEESATPERVREEGR